MTSFTRPNILSTATRKSTNTRVVLGGSDQHQIQQSPKVPSNHLDPVVVDPFFVPPHSSYRRGCPAMSASARPDSLSSLLLIDRHGVDRPGCALNQANHRCKLLFAWLNEWGSQHRWPLRSGVWFRQVFDKVGPPRFYLWHVSFIFSPLGQGLN